MDFSSIRCPADIKNYSLPQLRELAQFCRDLILKRTSMYGGHVGPDLGVVEATIAMCKVFDLPKDKIIWDVSHQVDVYKMLTGRMEAFTKPEPYTVISQYTIPSEAPEYDLFYAGHTSPSITLSLGLAYARKLKNEKFNIIAFIGDGSLSGGVAFEGLNEGAELRDNLIVIVNDNQMSIPEDHGGLYHNLMELRETNGTSDTNYFKSLGYEYFYVAEGNNVEALLQTLEKVKDTHSPTVVHINTQKGSGYIPAEKYREAYHYYAPYYRDSGQAKQQAVEPNVGTITRDYLLKKCAEVPELLIVATSTPETYDFMAPQRKQAGKHYLDLCICEQAGVSVTAGAAKGGIKPVYPVVSTFLQRAIDQMIEDLSLDNVPGVLVVLCGGVYGIPDATHLGFWDIPLLSNIPNLVYLAPTGFREYEAMLDWAIAQNEHPVAVRAPYGPVEDAEEQPERDFSDLNKFKVIRKGEKVAIIAAGGFYRLGRETADLLKEQGIEATLVNPRFISGIDKDLLDALKKDHTVVVTLEDGSLEGGFGSKIALFYGPSGMKVMCRGLEKKFLDHYDPHELLIQCHLAPDLLAADILEALKA